MALTNAERQKRWRAKNRVIYNLRRRNARKNPVQEAESDRASVGHAISEDRTAGSSPATGATFQTKKVGEFRMLVMPTETPEESATMPVAKPKVFLNDHGAAISESVWNDLQEKKRVAKENGYEYDPQ